MYGGNSEVENVPVFSVIAWDGNPHDIRRVHLHNELRHVNCGGKVSPVRGRMENNKVIYEGCPDNAYKARCEKCSKYFCIGLD